jgi:sugar phosphate isomerase/epimerase
MAVSSIAWTNEEEAVIAEKLRELGVKHVEIAPTKVWEDPTKASIEDAKAYVDWWAQYGITVSAFQSMLFARPDLKTFADDKNRKETEAYMRKFIRLAGVMGAKKMVFGSPKNRQRGDMPTEQADHIARNFFGALGDEALNSGVVLCIEPNAPQYNCDYVTTATEGAELVKSVNNKGFGLHLDTACMMLAGDDLAGSIIDYQDVLEHFHISSPMLGVVEAGTPVDHVSAAKALHDIGYSKLVSIEMRPGDAGINVARVEKAIQFAQETYFA